MSNSVEYDVIQDFDGFLFLVTYMSSDGKSMRDEIEDALCSYVNQNDIEPQEYEDVVFDVLNSFGDRISDIHVSTPPAIRV